MSYWSLRGCRGGTARTFRGSRGDQLFGLKLYPIGHSYRFARLSTFGIYQTYAKVKWVFRQKAVSEIQPNKRLATRLKSGESSRVNSSMIVK